MSRLALILALASTSLLSISLLAPRARAADDATNQVLWYAAPAQHWHEALPVGNGRLGALVHGGVESELLQLNEDSVWSGRAGSADGDQVRDAIPQVQKLLFAGQFAAAEAMAKDKLKSPLRADYGSYQPLGDLRLEFEPDLTAVRDYRRELNLDTAVAATTFQRGGVKFRREVFASAPAQVLVVRLSASKPRAISFRAHLGRLGAAARAADADTLTLAARCDEGGTEFGVALRIIAQGGRVLTEGGVASVSEADSVVLLLSVATSYYHPQQPLPEIARAVLAKAATQSFERLLAAHVQEHQGWARRCALSLRSDAETAARPTDERLRRAGAGEADPGLGALYFNYGRYLLIASSRPGTLPANLQGIWNPLPKPPWYCDYTINVNFQMNYWPAEVTNLAECHTPVFDLMEAQVPLGRETARVRFGAPGIALSTRTTPFGRTDLRGSSWLFWPEAAAWMAAHFWEHWQYSGDRDFLARRAYPYLREAARFYLATLVENPQHGWLVSGPTVSPENSYLAPDGTRTALDMGPAMTMALVRELFAHTLAAAEILGIDDPALLPELRAKRARLAPIRVGRDGRLLEWSEDFTEVEPRHRHISHLYPLYPGAEISVQRTPALAAAARKSIEARLAGGGGYVGWSRAWLLTYWARLEDAEKAHESLVALFRESTFPNLFDNHWRKDGHVFQIDGNFGTTAAIAEMLLQSHDGELNLLPTLPAGWAEGEVRGLRGRHGYTVDLAWDAHTLRTATVRASAANQCRIRTRQPVTVARDGQVLARSQADGASFTTTFQTEAGATYTISR